ncbi:hypothetical protein B9Z19DRAFT_1069423 [Tuber borchii]|uniref:Uncharacterized protein n=1 Tax=Tuber borchii TaxID=42251 RepID=A0A2T6ZBL9_TUBBO|nr:hypothetical protein B9Z19DRAFT_1069423 [Tuber borchii]
MSFSKFLTRSTTSVRTDTFRHPANRMCTAINRCLRPAINHAQQRGGLPITMLRHSPSLMRYEAKSLKHSREQHAGFREQEAIRSREQQAVSFQHFENQPNCYREQQAQSREQETLGSQKQQVTLRSQKQLARSLERFEG